MFAWSGHYIITTICFNKLTLSVLAGEGRTGCVKKMQISFPDTGKAHVRPHSYGKITKVKVGHWSKGQKSWNSNFRFLWKSRQFCSGGCAQTLFWRLCPDVVPEVVHFFLTKKIFMHNKYLSILDMLTLLFKNIKTTTNVQVLQ